MTWQAQSGWSGKEAATRRHFKNSGKLNLALDKGRYGNLQSLRANVDASYSPEGLDVPIIFFATSNMDFHAIARTKGDALEIDKIQLNQVASPPSRAAQSQRRQQRARPTTSANEIRVRLCLHSVYLEESRDQCRSHSIFWQSVCDISV